MGTDRAKDSQQANPYWMHDDPMADSKQSMDSPAHEQSSRSVFPSIQISTSRPFTNRFHPSSDPMYEYQDLQPTPSMHGNEVTYTQYLQGPLQLQQTQHELPHSQYASYQPILSFSRPQNPYVFDATSHLQSRQPSTHQTVINSFTSSPYLSSDEHNSTSVTRARYPFTPKRTSHPIYGPSFLGDTQTQPSFDTTDSDNLAAVTQAEEQEYDNQKHSTRKRKRSKSKPSFRKNIENVTHEIHTFRSQKTLSDFENELKVIFSIIIAGRIKEASEKLLAISRWLLCSETIERFSLHFDDRSEPRKWLPFWREFNHCWEALGQKQKDMTEEVFQSQNQLSLPAQLLSSGHITRVLDELVGLCDQVEKYGLVDYEIGVWEEEIVSIFIICLDLLPTP